jgi:hypothetical protein
VLLVFQLIIKEPFRLGVVGVEAEPSGTALPVVPVGDWVIKITLQSQAGIHTMFM